MTSFLRAQVDFERVNGFLNLNSAPHVVTVVSFIAEVNPDTLSPLKAEKWRQQKNISFLFFSQ